MGSAGPSVPASPGTCCRRVAPLVLSASATLLSGLEKKRLEEGRARLSSRVCCSLDLHRLHFGGRCLEVTGRWGWSPACTLQQGTMGSLRSVRCPGGCRVLARQPSLSSLPEAVYWGRFPRGCPAH